MTKRLALAKDNKDVLFDTSPDDKTYDSRYDTLKYYLSNTVDLEVNGANAETNITHGLGYVPFFVVYVNRFASFNPANYSMCPGTFKDVFAYLYANAYADDDKLYFRIETASAVNTFTFYYKIFRNDTGL